MAQNPDLYSLIREFEKAARPSANDPTAPATVQDIDNLVTQTAVLLKNWFQSSNFPAGHSLHC